MKKIRILVCFLLVFICVTAFCSCGKKDTLTLNSGLFTELEAKEVDIEWLDNYWISEETNCYTGPQFKIVERDGKIYQEETEYHKAYWQANSYVCCLYYRYLVAVDYGDSDYWISVIDDGSSYIEGAKSERVLNMRCTGLLQGQEPVEFENGEVSWFKNPNLAYAFVFDGAYTNLPSYEDYFRGYIYRYENISETEYQFEKFVELDAIPTAFMMDEDKIIVATRSSLCSVDAEGKITQLFTSDYWRHLSIDSIVKIDNCYYLGTHAGILKYDIATKEDIWYPYYNEDKE